MSVFAESLFDRASRSGRRWGHLMSAVACAVALWAAAPAPARANSGVETIQLAGKPSDWLAAPDDMWKVPLADALPLLEARRANWSSLSAEKQIEWHIHAAVLAQAQGRWAAAIESVQAARALQTSPSGRQTAGLLNELLARQALARGDEASLRALTRDTVLAMKWDEVEPAILSIRQALAGMERQAVQGYVEGRMDLSVGITKGQVTLPFLMQLLGARFQVQQVLPHRAALLTGLDDAIRQRSGALPATR